MKENPIQLFIIVFLCAFYIQAKGQTGETGTIKVQKPSCCDALYVGFFHYRGQDTISFNNMINEQSIAVLSANCKRDGMFRIKSFDLTINDKNKFAVKGNEFNFKTLGELRNGGKITITNCKVNCEMSDEIPKIVIIEKKELFIKK